jgi:hypothetical protein
MVPAPGYAVRMGTLSRHWLLSLAIAVVPALPAQDDLRDRLTRTDGRTITGRVVDPFAAGELTLLQGGKRVRVARSELRAIDRVGDRVRAFLLRRAQMQDRPKAQEYLIDEAQQAELPGLARLQALWVVLHDDDNGKAHEFLGHQRGPKGWLWLHDGRRMSREQLEVELAEHPLRLVGERFALRCSAGLRANTAALFDLERLAVEWHDAFGADLGLREVLQPIEVITYRRPEEFPKWGFRPRPYHEPAPHGDVARTFYRGPAPDRPEQLFFVGTHALLYHTLIGEVSRQDQRDRVCSWLEIGLSMRMELSMQGPPGFAAPGPLRAQDMQALGALGRSYRLTHLLHLPMYGSFYLTDDLATAVNWSAATMFTAWLLEPDNQPATRAPFLAFVRQALGERKGDSSSLFDRMMGRAVEDLDEPFRVWLEKVANG